jgi:putative ABC transport system permease protein
MLKNYFIVAMRHFWKNKIFSLITVFGLSIGISSALVIFLIVHYEFSFDTFEKDNARIYRVVTDSKFGGNIYHFSGVPVNLSQKIKNELTGIEETIGFIRIYSDIKVSVPKKQGQPSISFRHQPYIIFADQNYFRFINYQWLAGSPKSSLNEPFKVVLSEERAKLYFPGIDNAEIIGKQIIYNDSTFVTISGVVKELSNNTDFIFEEFISTTTKTIDKNYSSALELWIKTKPNISPVNLETQLNKLMTKSTRQLNKNDENSIVYRLQPLSDLHFNTTYNAYGISSANKPTLYGLLIVAAFLLLLGSINFINLTTAQAAQRSKEIGIRKTIGSSKKQLMLQFLIEAFFITLLATIISVPIARALLIIFEDFVPKNLHVDLIHQPFIFLFLIALIIIVTFLSGFYPAIVLSGYKPIYALKNLAYTGTTATRKARLRKILTVSQFFVAQVLIMATLISSKQIHYMLNTDLGYKKDAIVLFGVPMHENNNVLATQRRSAMQYALHSIPGIQMISVDNGAPISPGISSLLMKYKSGKRQIETDVELKTGDSNYLALFHIRLLAGRMVKQSDTLREYLINETYLHILGFKNPLEALNKLINNLPIVGVISDFHERPFYSRIKPLVFSSTNDNYQFSVALKPQGVSGLSWETIINKIKKAYKEIYPDEEFEYDFFDESIRQLYEREQNLSKLLQWATGLSILICSLGLFGLVIYTTNIRTKEIGIRKIMGASVMQIVSVLSKDFVMLVLLAFLIATPMAWWIMHNWLQNFVYRITISWWFFIISGALMLTIALITMSIRIIQSANVNPVKSLRSE